MLKKILKCIWYFLLVLFSFISVFLIMFAEWYKKHYSNISFSQLLYHAKADLSGADTSLIDGIFSECMSIPIFVSIGVIIFLIIKCFFIKDEKIKKWLSYTSTLLTIFFLVLFCYGANKAYQAVGIDKYIEMNSQVTNLYEDYYVDPKEVTFTFPEKKRNLIYIFLESMESTYEDNKNGGSTSKNYIPELTKLQEENLTFNGGKSIFNGFHVLSGTQWTMAAIIAQTSGVPLCVGEGWNNSITSGDFLPNAYSIGDILGAEGYYQEFMCGSDVNFGGRKNYLNQHGKYNYFDLFYARRNGYVPSDYGVWWGYEDNKLFEFAKSELTRISANSQPFNFTMLTADTHATNGYLCENCSNTYSEQYSNVIRCSSKNVAQFIEWCKEQPFYENTTIVIAGDHTSMDDEWFEDKIPEGYIRKGYYTIINSVATPQRNEGREICTFDLFPTTLASLGITYDSNRLGFGTNLYSDEDTLVETLGLENFDMQLSMRSDYYINYLFGGREVDVSKSDAKKDEKVDNEQPVNEGFALPEYFTGTYNGVDYYNGSSSDQVYESSVQDVPTGDVPNEAPSEENGEVVEGDSTEDNVPVPDQDMPVVPEVPEEPPVNTEPIETTQASEP